MTYEVIATRQKWLVSAQATESASAIVSEQASRRRRYPLSSTTVSMYLLDRVASAFYQYRGLPGGEIDTDIMIHYSLL